jgi:hypothetical protein
MKRICVSVALLALLQFPLFAVPTSSIVETESFPSIFVDNRSGMPRERVRAMGDADFKLLRSLLKEESFDKNRAKMIRVACIGNYFTSSQCAAMLSLFSFDSNKLEVLEYLAPRVIDRRGCEAILEEFSFLSNRKKAEDLLKVRRR